MNECLAILIRMTESVLNFIAIARHDSSDKLNVRCRRNPRNSWLLPFVVRYSETTSKKRLFSMSLV
jgi:hypothetical protein